MKIQFNAKSPEELVIKSFVIGAILANQQGRLENYLIESNELLTSPK